MLIGIGVFIVGLGFYLVLGLFLSIAVDMEWEIGYLIAVVPVAVVGVYFTGKIIAVSLNLI